MMNHVERISADLYRQLESLLKSGVVEKEGKLLDLSPVQTITIGNGIMQFDPPAKCSGKFGMFRIQTTISEISLKAGSGIKVDINNSPIDLEIHPE